MPTLLGHFFLISIFLSFKSQIDIIQNFAVNGTFVSITN
jgi:hypothetical protein